jgi:hypothetical protein
MHDLANAVEAIYQQAGSGQVFVSLVHTHDVLEREQHNDPDD